MKTIPLLACLAVALAVPTLPRAPLPVTAGSTQVQADRDTPEIARARAAALLALSESEHAWVVEQAAKAAAAKALEEAAAEAKKPAPQPEKDAPLDNYPAAQAKAGAENKHLIVWVGPIVRDELRLAFGAGCVHCSQDQWGGDTTPAVAFAYFSPDGKRRGGRFELAGLKPETIRDIRPRLDSPPLAPVTLPTAPIATSTYFQSSSSAANCSHASARRAVM